MAQNKPLFIPWLRQQIDSGGYPGVQWVNQERTHFSIPWKHALRQDSNSHDVMIFKAWAQTSATSDGRIPGDPSVWKRNFRSALRARRFQLVADNKNDGANPHKVYKFPEDSPSGSQERSPGSDILDSILSTDDRDPFLDGSHTPDLLEKCLSGLNIHEVQPAPCAAREPFFDDQFQYCDARFPVQETGNVAQISPAEGAVGGIAFSPAEGVPGVGTGTPAQGASNDSGANQFETHFNVKVYYKGEKVFEQLVENQAGFQIVYKEDASRGAGGLNLVKLPSAASLLDQTQAKLTQSILENLGGVEVTLKDGLLYGHRWGESRVYWGLDKHEQKTLPRQLSKNHPEPLYYPKDFISNLITFIQNGRESPSPSLFFCLGLQWPDPKNRPWEKMLIWVEVTLTALDSLKAMAVARGASSLQSSVELQISLEQMMDWF